MLHLTKKVCEAFDNNAFILGVFFIDLSKAFDTANHKIFLDKLIYFGMISERLYTMV